MADSDPKDQEFERFKMAVDSVKHITTLATGTIVLVATFIDKLPKPVFKKDDLIGAIFLMVVCLVSSFIYLWGSTLAGYVSTLNRVLPRWLPGRKHVLMLMSVVIYFSFIMGIYFLAKFAFYNIPK
jgi:hypothetical protein